MNTEQVGQLEILGWTDDTLDCDVCEKPLDRERTLAYRIGDGPVQHAGSYCAGTLAGTTAAKVVSAADRIAREAKEAEAAAAQAKRNARHALRLQAEADYLSELTGRTIKVHAPSWGPNGLGAAADEIHHRIRREGGGYRAIIAYNDEIERRTDALE